MGPLPASSQLLVGQVKHSKGPTCQFRGLSLKIQKVFVQLQEKEMKGRMGGKKEGGKDWRERGEINSAEYTFPKRMDKIQLTYINLYSITET